MDMMAGGQVALWQSLRTKRNGKSITCTLLQMVHRAKSLFEKSMPLNESPRRGVEIQGAAKHMVVVHMVRIQRTPKGIQPNTSKRYSTGTRPRAWLSLRSKVGRTRPKAGWTTRVQLQAVPREHSER